MTYRLQGGQIESGLLLYQGEAENVFLLMIQPPKRVLPQHIPPREYLFIVDVSGSMHGFPLDTSKRLLIDLLTSLRPIDTFNVLLFAGSSDVLADGSLPATGANVQGAIRWLKEQQGSGGTELLPALRRAMQMPQAEPTSRTIVIATDGYVSVEAEAFALVRRHLNQANVFAFGIGTAVNHHLIEGLARAGAGEPFVITHQAEAPAAAEKFRVYVQTPVLTDIQIHYGGFEVYDVEPLSLPDVFAERPVIIFGKWRGKPQGQVTIQGRQGAQPYTRTLAVETVTPLLQHAALRYLWARHRIATLDDDDHLRPDPQRTAQITQLGLQYSLLTRHTSFVAVDDLVRTMSDGDSPTVTQPLPLPVGVSNYAVSGSVPTVPEPETYLLLGVLGGLLLWRLVPCRQGLSGMFQRLRAWTSRV